MIVQSFRNIDIESGQRPVAGDLPRDAGERGQGEQSDRRQPQAARAHGGVSLPVRDGRHS
jgi:hypothetical protein